MLTSISTAVVIEFYFAFGKSDVYLIVDMPDTVTAAAVSLAVNQSGAVSLKSQLLITPEEVDKAAKRTVAYRAPGKQAWPPDPNGESR